MKQKVQRSVKDTEKDTNEHYSFDLLKMRFSGTNPGKQTQRILFMCMIAFVVLVACLLLAVYFWGVSFGTITSPVVVSSLLSFFIGKRRGNNKTPPP